MQVVEDATIQLAHVPRALAEMTGQMPPGYRRLHQLVLNAAIPAEMVRGRWHIQRAHLRAIAEFLGMTAPAPVAPPTHWGPPPRPAWPAPESWAPAQPVRSPQ